MTKLQTWLAIGVVILLFVALGISGWLLFQNNKLLKQKQSTPITIETKKINLDSFHRKLDSLTVESAIIKHELETSNRRIKRLLTSTNKQNEVFNRIIIDRSKLSRELSNILENN
jgi:uncharacterized membrane-anchored protein YhcB (DUF1043 family)